MAYSLEEFTADCRGVLKQEPGPAGRENVCDRLNRLLMDDNFVARYCGPGAEAGAHVLYRDPDLGFQVLAHIMEKDHVGGPHDHGSSWAIYGQAVKHTDMTVWNRLDDGSAPGRAEIERDRTFRMDRGTVGVFDDGAVHSIAYPAGARFIRVTGTDLSTIERRRFDADAGTVVLEKRPIFGSTA